MTARTTEARTTARTEARTTKTAATGRDARTAKVPARPARRSRADSETDDSPEDRLRADRIDETLTRLTAAHAGLVLGRYDETDGEDDEDEDDDTRAPRARPAVRVGRYAVAAVALLLVLAAGVGWVGRTRLDGALTQVAAVDVAPDGVLDAVAQTGDENVLVVAIDSGGSAGATTRANTVTVVHRDARGDRTVAVTLPPQLEITRPPCERWDPAAAAYLGQTVPAEPRTTFDSAYAVGGPLCATRAAQQVTGLAITRFVAVDLAATSALVEAVGGVQVCVEQPVLDSVLGPVVATAGTDAFNGARAATLVRAADVRGEPAGGAALVQRQQRVLAAALERALSPTALLHPGRVGRLLPALGTAVVSTGTGVADLLALSSAPGEVRAVPTEPQENSRGNVEMRKTEAQALFTAVRTDAPLPARDEAAATASAPADVTADVLNASGRDGLAAEVGGHPRRPGLPHRGGAERGPARARHRRPLLPGPSGTGPAACRGGAVGERGARSRHHRGAAARARPVVRRHGPRLHRPGGSRRRSRPHRPRPAAERRPPFTGGSPAAPASPERRNYARRMRDAYQEQLTALGDALADMCLQTAVAMEDATRALLEADLQLAEQVIADDVRIDDLRAAAEEKAFGLLALQAPVATDLRVVISAIHGAGDIERMGDLALHVAQAARRRHPQLGAARRGGALLRRDGEDRRRARAQGRPRSSAAATSRWPRTLEADDDAMDDLHRHLFSVLMAPSWSHGVGAGGRRHPARPVLRALRGSRRHGRAPRRLRRDRSDARPAGGLTRARWPRPPFPSSSSSSPGCSGRCARKRRRTLRDAVRRPAGRPPAAGREDRRR